MARDPYKYFRIEARDLLDQLGKGVLSLEKGPPAPDLVSSLLRYAHTLKGAARVVKQKEIADFAHTIEDVLSPLREGTTQMQGRVDSALELLDAIQARLAELAKPEESDGKAARRLVEEESGPTLPTDPAEVDALLDGVAEAHVQLASLRRVIASLEKARQLTERLAPVRLQRGPDTASMHARPAVDEVNVLLADAERDLSAGVEQVDRELGQMRETAERLRLLPAGLMFHALERAARDDAQSLGSKVSFVTRGGEVRLQAPVLGIVQNALLQAVRNAVAHGIEPEAERVAAGKSPEGRITLEVVRRGNRVAFVCHDDGRGIDFAAVRRVAQRRADLPADVENIGGEELLRLLLKGGISTAETVTEVSGRGVGLDVIREATKRLGGEVTMHTEAARGTTVEIIVPVSLSSLDALVVEASGQVVAIPLDAVRRTIRVDPAEVARSAQGESIVLDGRTIPFAPLDRVLRPSASAPGAVRVFSAVVVEGNGSLAAVGVDRLRGVGNLVLRPLPAWTPDASIVAGATKDSEGKLQLVLDPEQLVAQARRSDLRPPAPTPSRPPILVIDDSMTTRMLEQSILESAGYRVDLAVSGEDALEKALRKPFALFLVDVEMPGMDGFTFIERARSDPALRDIPAILVTSNSSAEHRQRGRTAGARGYIVKGEFDQRELLDKIRELMG